MRQPVAFAQHTSRDRTRWGPAGARRCCQSPSMLRPKTSWSLRIGLRREPYEAACVGRDGDCSPPPAQIRTCSFPAYGLYGAFFVKVSRQICLPLSFHSFVRPAPPSILPPRPHISIAVARSGGQGRRFFSAAEGSSLTDASTAAGCRRRVVGRARIRGEPAIGRDQTRTTLVFG